MMNQIGDPLLDNTAGTELDNSAGQRKEKRNRMGLGIIVLVIVDLIWVTSSELTEYTFHHEKYSKPFFSTYLKTSMFLVFLFGFLFHRNWREQCTGLRKSHGQQRHFYVPIRTDAPDSRSDVAGDYSNGPEAESNSSPPIDDNCNEEEGVSSSLDGDRTALSPPSFIPVKYDRSNSSGNESEDSTTFHHRSVRFHKLAEVRHLSDSEAAEALFSRMSYQASISAEELAKRLASRLGILDTAKLAIVFCFLWFSANYTYQLALSHTEAGIVNVLSSSSSFFTLILSNFFPAIDSDKFTLSKFLAVGGSMLGVIAVSYSDLGLETIPIGSMYAIISSMLYAVYIVFLRKTANHEDKLDIPMFFGFVGLFNLVLLWPLFFLLNYTEFELFSWPNSKDWIILIINGVIGTVFSEVLWLWGCFLTSSLIATLSVSLMIPMTMLADVFIKKITYSYLFYIGTVPIIISFLSVSLLSHFENWDPAGDWVRKCVGLVMKRRETGYVRVLGVEPPEEEEEEQEQDPSSLIGSINHDEGDDAANDN